MNQILENKNIKKLNKKIYVLQFLLTITIFLLLIIYLIWEKYSKIREKKLLDLSNNNYFISRLYSNNYDINIKSNNTYYSIIGFIEIPKLQINYPILSQCSEDFLKISVCKFYGPNIGEPGNLCIAGHNYNNSDFFSNLNLLKINDTINLYTTNSLKFSYKIYNIYESNPEDVSFIFPDAFRES